EIKKAIEDQLKFSNPVSLKDEAVGNFTMYADGPVAFALTHELTLVLGQPAAVKAVLERNKRPEFSIPLKAALKQIDFEHAAFALALEAEALAEEAKKAVPLAASVSPVPIPPVPEEVDKIEAFSLQINLGDPFEVKAVVLCKDAKVAKEFNTDNRVAGSVRTLVTSNADAPKEVPSLVDSIKAENKGNRLIITFRSKLDPVVAAAKQMAAMAKQPVPMPMPMPEEEKKE
ncbi:MAG: hypothetical protein AB7K24_28605, partial [Gemmataceae bacterium]